MINRRTLTTELNVFEDFRPVLPPPYREARIVLLGNISPDLQCSVLDQAKAPDLVIADTMDLWINRTRTRLLEVIERSNVLMLNDGEARLLTGSSGVRDCAATILKWGPQYVVIKKGEHGALLFSRQGIFVVPAFPVPAVRDPTGAGDAFAGGFAGAIARFGPLTGDSIRHALLVGSAVASFSVQEFSLEGLKGIGLQDIGARLAEMKRMMSAGQEPEQWIGAP
jgi:sugar/nucleoside kinase (ribokinase family)